MTFDVFDVVVTQFPFVERNAGKRRPALVLSGGDFETATGVALLAMITTGKASQWPLDVPLSDLVVAGLRHDCVVRMKLATLDLRLLERRLGTLGDADRAAVGKSLAALLPVEGRVP